MESDWVWTKRRAGGRHVLILTSLIGPFQRHCKISLQHGFYTHFLTTSLARQPSFFPAQSLNRFLSGILWDKCAIQVAFGRIACHLWCPQSPHPKHYSSGTCVRNIAFSTQPCSKFVQQAFPRGLSSIVHGLNYLVSVCTVVTCITTPKYCHTGS